MSGPLELDFGLSNGLIEHVAAADAWDILEETGRLGPEYAPGPIVQISGTISFKLHGQELLGRNYLFELFNMGHLSPLAAGVIESATVSCDTSTYDYGRLRFARSGSQVNASLEVAETNKFNRQLPLRPLCDAWTYLWFRVQRLAAELGDQTAISATSHRADYFPANYFDHVDTSLIDFACEAPLQEVLATPKSFG